MKPKTSSGGDSRRPRHRWAEIFEAAGSSEYDELLLKNVEPNEFDREEWEW